jgi:hypothetical protein
MRFTLTEEKDMFGQGNDKQVACPNCFQMNHYNAKRCQHCLGDTWRTPTGGTGETELPSTLSMWTQIVLVTILLAYFFGATPAALWLGGWIVAWIIEQVGLGRILLLGLIGFVLAVLFL